MATIPYKFKQNKRTKGINLKINIKGELTITSSRKLNDDDIQKLLLKHQAWIDGVRSKQPSLTTELLTDGAQITLYGDIETVKYVASAGKSKVVEKGQYLEVHAPEGKHTETLHNWMLKIARQGIIARTQELAAEFGFKYQKVAVRDQSSRWGSCSQTKNLNFNWRLVLAPLEILDYVILHELAHTKQMNHSKAFWGIVAECVPNYKQHIRWLKQNGSMLHMY